MNRRSFGRLAAGALAAVVTPPDPVTQLILFSAVYGLYEISIQLVKWVEKKKTEELRAEGILDEDEDLYGDTDDDDDEDEDAKT